MSSKGANRFRSDGSLRRNEVVAKKQVVRQMIDRVPDELSRIDSDALRAAVVLLANIVKRSRRPDIPTTPHIAQRIAQLLEPPPPPPPPPPPSTDVADTSAHHTRRPHQRTLKWPPT